MILNKKFFALSDFKSTFFKMRQILNKNFYILLDFKLKIFSSYCLT